MNISQYTSVFLSLCLLAAAPAAAQEKHSTVYASVLSSGLFIVGAANSGTGLYWQKIDGDTAWTHTGAQRIRAFGMAATRGAKGRTLYIASGNGVHRTSDGGAHWRITTDWRSAEIMSIAIDPRNENILYASTPYGIFKSTDAAGSWNEVGAGLDKSKFVSTVLVDCRNGASLFCSTDDGVYTSTDAGATWTRMDMPAHGARTVRQSAVDPRLLAAGTENDGLFLSRDGGATWTQCRGLEHATIYAVEFDPKNSAVLYAGGFKTGVYKSVDGGASWTQSNDGLGNLNVHSIAVDPANTRRVYAATIWGGVFRSEDAGAHWKYAGLFASQVWDVKVIEAR